MKSDKTGRESGRMDIKHYVAWKILCNTSQEACGYKTDGEGLIIMSHYNTYLTV